MKREIDETRDADPRPGRPARILTGLLDCFDDAVFVIDPGTGRYLDVNEQACRSLGYPAAELLRLGVADVVEGLTAPGRWTGFAREVAAAGRLVRHGRHRRRDGVSFPVEASARLVRNGERDYLVIMTREEAERPPAEQPGRLHGVQYRELFQNMTSGVAVYEAVDGGGDFVFVDFNPAAERIDGIRREEVLGKRVTEVFPRVREFGLLKLLRRVWETGAPESLQTSFYDDGRLSGWRDNCVYRLPSGEIVAVYEDATAGKQAEQGLHDALRFLETLIDTIPTPLFCKDVNGAYTHCNTAFAESILGLPKEKILGRSVHQLPDAIPADLADLYAEQDRRLLREGEPQRYEAEVRGADGKRRNYLFGKATFPDASGGIAGIIGVMIDIEQRNQAAAALRASEERVTQILDTLPDLVYELAPDGTVLYANKSASEILGIPLDRVGKLNMAELLDPEGLATASQEVARMLATGKPSRNVSYNLRAADGSMLPVEVHAIPLAGPQGTTILGLARDVSERKRAEEERCRLEKVLRQNQKMEALGALAGGIAHDFNNLLGVMSGFTELALMDVPTDSRLRANLEQILVSVRRASRLVKQVLAFNRDSEQERSPVDLCEIVRETLEFARATLPAAIEVREEILVNEGQVLADPVQIRQALINLYTNALQAMRERGGCLEVRVSKTEISPDGKAPEPGPAADPALMVSVRDTGEGMGPEILERVFDPFFTTRRNGEGSGMGLAVTHGIIQSHGGRIWVESEPGKGTIFHVVLPRLAPARTPATPDLQFPAAGGQQHGCVLFVDDEQAIATLGQMFLEHLGFEAVAASESLQAREIFANDPGRFVAVVTDLSMAGMDGLELSREILRMRPDIPVILCTGLHDELSQEAAREHGIRRVLHKPVLFQEFAEAIRDALRPSTLPADQKRGKVLVVDDDPQVRDMLCQALERNGCTVLQARDGKEALIEYDKHLPGVLITDLFMPDKDGLELIMNLRQRHPESRIIAISGGGRFPPGQYLNIATRLGARHAFTKPFDLESVLKKVQELLLDAESSRPGQAERPQACPNELQPL